MASPEQLKLMVYFREPVLSSLLLSQVIDIPGLKLVIE